MRSFCNYIISESLRCAGKVGSTLLILIIMCSASVGFAKASTVSEPENYSVVTLSQAKDEFKKKNYAEAIRDFRILADQGDSIAQYNYALMLFKGLGATENINLAIELFRKAAEQGLLQAQINLGYIYAAGKIIHKDDKEAAKWYLKASNNAGKDFLKWLEKAAQLKNISAQLSIANTYEYGKGVKKDFSKSFKWYLEAAKQGDVSAQSKIALMYSSGKGVKKDRYAAYKWDLMAAKLGSTTSQYNLALHYWKGDGVVPSYAAAVDWFYKAGSAYLKEGERDMALASAERINNISTKHQVPNAFLEGRLLSKIYGANYDSVPQKNRGNTEAHDKPASSGTAWSVRGGLVVTNHHVISGHKKFTLVRADGVKISATVLLDDVINDLVLLKPESIKNLPNAIPLATQAAQVGSRVFAIGYPHPDLMGTEVKLTQGIINARTGFKNDPRVYQISVPLQGGNSGGPLINMNGEVVGVTTSKMSALKVFKWTGDLPQNVNYAVKSDYVKILLSSIDHSKLSVKELPSKKGDLETLAKRIEKSVMMIIAE